MQKVPEKVLSSNNFELLKHMFESSIKRKDKFTQDVMKNYISSWLNEKGEKDKDVNDNSISGGINYYRANLNRVLEKSWRKHSISKNQKSHFGYMGRRRHIFRKRVDRKY
jgi:hypothetical protein